MNALHAPGDVRGLPRHPQPVAACDDADTTTFDVVGPICETGDVLGRGRRLPRATAEGDVLLVADAGAYGMAMANTYNLRALPAEDMIE